MFLVIMIDKSYSWTVPVIKVGESRWIIFLGHLVCLPRFFIEMLCSTCPNKLVAIESKALFKKTKKQRVKCGARKYKIYLINLCCVHTGADYAWNYSDSSLIIIGLTCRSMKRQYKQSTSQCVQKVQNRLVKSKSLNLFLNTFNSIRWTCEDLFTHWIN